LLPLRGQRSGESRKRGGPMSAAGPSQGASCSPSGGSAAAKAASVGVHHWIDALAELRARGLPAVIVSVASTKGSAPREAGTRMIVARDSVHGTIGGGHLELQAISIARDLLEDAGDDRERLRRFPLGASLGQCCGGLVHLLFEPAVGPLPWLDVLVALRRDGVPCVIVSATRGAADGDPLIVTADRAHGTLDANDAAAIRAARELLANGAVARMWRSGDVPDAPLFFLDPIRASDFDIVLFGAGHVGRALVGVLAGVDCRVTWVDSRDDEFPADVPRNVTVVCSDAPEEEIDAARPRSYFLVMTHSHPLDEALAERILRRNDAAYFGLIGSVAKRRQFERRMERRGMPPVRFAAMTCPIGVAGIPGKEPATIAIAVAAELLQARAKAITYFVVPAKAGTQ
jgi:xanthine dehydrogenase accessory factor